jgi:hypothetical protein
MPNEPSEEFHGKGSEALFKQAEYLEAHIFDQHVLVALDPAGKAHECALETPAEVLDMVDRLRSLAETWRKIEESRPWN